MTSIQPWAGMSVRDVHQRSRLILARFRADADPVADVDERRHLHDQAGFGARGLHLRARRRALDAGRRVLDAQIDGHRQIDADRLVAVELHLDDRVGQDVVDRIAEHFAIDVQLLERLRVHEMKRVAVGVEILHVVLVENRALDVFFRAELVIDERVRSDVPRPALHEAALVAGREVMELENAQQVVADLDEIALPEPCCLN